MTKTSILDRIQVVIFGAMSAITAVGIIKGAWWHIGTLAICLTIVTASISDIKKEEAAR